MTTYIFLRIPEYPVNTYRVPVLYFEGYSGILQRIYVVILYRISRNTSEDICCYTLQDIREYFRGYQLLYFTGYPGILQKISIVILYRISGNTSEDICCYTLQDIREYLRGYLLLCSLQDSGEYFRGYLLLYFTLYPGILQRISVVILYRISGNTSEDICSYTLQDIRK